MRYDKDSIIRDTDLDSVLHQLNIPVKKQGRRTMIICPFHHDKHFGSAYAYDDGNKKGVHCFACGARYNVVSLVGTMLHLDYKESLEWLADNQCGGKEKYVLYNENDNTKNKDGWEIVTDITYSSAELLAANLKKIFTGKTLEFIGIKNYAVNSMAITGDIKNCYSYNPEEKELKKKYIQDEEEGLVPVWIETSDKSYDFNDLIDESPDTAIEIVVGKLQDKKNDDEKLVSDLSKVRNLLCQNQVYILKKELAKINELIKKVSDLQEEYLT